MAQIEGRYPWKLTSMLLNYLLGTIKSKPRIDSQEFPGPEGDGLPCPLPEDYSRRGLVYAEEYFPEGWFDNDKIDETDRYLESGICKKATERQEQILWIGRRLASSGKWLTWNGKARRFSVAKEYDAAL